VRALPHWSHRRVGQISPKLLAVWPAIQAVDAQASCRHHVRIDMDLLDASRWHTGRRHSIEGPAGKHLPFEQIVLDPVHVLPAQQGWRTSPQFTLWFELQTCPLEQLPPQLMVPVP
jgi:hypothetical protein